MKLRVEWPVVGAVLVFSALMLAGCGSSGEDALTKNEFVKQGNAICEKAEKQRLDVVQKTSQELGLKPTTGGTTSQNEKIIVAALAPYEASISELDDLQPPAGDEKKIERLIEAMEESVAAVRASPETALTTNLPFKEADEVASDYGLTKCVV